MGFGFDPSIILSAKQYQGPDANETMRTLADLALRHTQQQQSQATLADMLRKQGQERSLADILARNPTDLRAAAVEARQRGLGALSFGVEDQASQVDQQKAQHDKLLADMVQKGREQLSNLLYGTKDQADYVRRLAAVPEQSRAFLPPTWEQAKPLIESIAIPAEKRATQAEDERHHRAEEAKPPPGIVVMGQGGMQYVADPRHPNAPARTITDENGNPIVKPEPNGPSRGQVAADRLVFEKAQHEVQGWEPTDPTNPQAISKEEAQGFRKALAARTQIREKIAEAKTLLEELGRVPSSLSTKGALAQQKIAELKPLLLLAGSFGNMTQGHVHVLEEAGSQKPTEFYNALNPSRLPALLDGMLQSTDAAINASGKSLGRRESATGGGGKAGGTGAAHPQDAAAVRWAKENPDSPKAAEILKANGIAVGAPGGTPL